MRYSPPEHRVLGSPFLMSCLRNRLREILKPVNPSQLVAEQLVTLPPIPPVAQSRLHASPPLGSRLEACAG